MATRETAAFLVLALTTAVGANAQTPVLVPTIPDIKIELPRIDLPVLADLQLMRIDVGQALDQSRDAMDKARIALADARIDLFDWQGQNTLLRTPRAGEASYSSSSAPGTR